MSFQNISSKTISMSLFWSVLENGGLSILSLFALVIYARFLSPAEFGLVATALAFIELLSVITGMMFHDALIRHPKPTSRHYDTALYTTILLSVVFCLAIIASSSKFEDLMKEPGSAEIVAALSFGLALTGFSATVSARLKKDFLFKKLALRSLISRALGLLLGVAAAIWGAGAWSLVIQYISMSAFSTIILWVYAPRSYTPKFQFGFSELTELLKFGSVSVTAILVQHSIKRVFVISCGIYLGAYATGLINMAFRLVDTLWAISASSINQVMLPVLSRISHDQKLLRRAYQTGVKLSCTVLFPIFFGLAATAPVLTSLLFGDKWIDSTLFILVFSFMIVLQAPRIFAFPLLTALGMPSRVLFVNVVTFTYMTLIVVTLGIGSYEAAAGIWVGAEVISTVFMAGQLRKVTSMSVGLQFKNALVPLFSGITMFVLVYFTKNSIQDLNSKYLELFILVFVGVVTYLAVYCIVDLRSLRELFSYLRNLREKGTLGEGASS